MLANTSESIRRLALVVTILLIAAAAYWAVEGSSDSDDTASPEAEAAKARFVPVVLDQAEAEPPLEESPKAEEFAEALVDLTEDEDLPVEEAEREQQARAELLVGQAQAPKKSKPAPAKKYEPAVLQVVTNFEKADVTINGLPYPEYVAPGEPEGVVLPAGGPYDIEVQYDGKTKSYRIHLRPDETRLLIVELSGYQGGSTTPRPTPPAPTPRSEPKTKAQDKDEEGDEGKVTVYSKPPGTVIVDGDKRPDKTPGTVDVPAGRHEVQVEYEDGGVSEKKIVRVRKGSRIKLFFRKRAD